MPGGTKFSYKPKVGSLVVTTLSAADTWTAIATKAQVKDSRGCMIKSRMSFESSGAPSHAPHPFDIAFSATPGNLYWSGGGQGTGLELGPSNGLFARSKVAGTVIEVLIFD